MIIPVRCFTCGKVLANKWITYQEKLNEGGQPKDENVELAENFDKNTKGKILDDLGLDRICCRRHMLSHIDLVDVL
jgi:DNA-directed RNA polymerase subunit N (RpoN/RPB10)